MRLPRTLGFLLAFSTGSAEAGLSYTSAPMALEECSTDCGAGSMALAARADGSFYALWTTTRLPMTSGFGLLGRAADPLDGLGEVTTFGRTGDLNQPTGSGGVIASGEGYLVALEHPGGRVRVQRLDGAGHLASPELDFPLPAAPDNDRPRVDPGPGGSSIVTWHRAVGGGRIVPYGQRLGPDDQPAGEYFEIDDQTDPGLSAGAIVCFDPQARGVAAWAARTHDRPADQPGEHFLYFRRLGNAGGVAGRALVAGPTPPILYLGVTATCEPKGGWFLAWATSVGGAGDLWFQRFDPNGKQRRGATRFKAGAPGAFHVPQVLIEPGGLKMLVFWREQLDTGGRILARRYNVATAKPIGGDFVAHETPEGQLGSFTVAWGRTREIILGWTQDRTPWVRRLAVSKR